MTNESQLAVASIIQRHPDAHAEVLGVRYEVIWPNGSTVHLHPVRLRGVNSTMYRCIHHAGKWWLFDLDQVLTRSQCEDVKHAPERDRVGLVMYALRRNFNSAGELLDKVKHHSSHSWAGEARCAGTRPTRTGRLAENVEA